MLFWAVDNPPPANYLLISGDRDFSNALHQLGLRRYNILLAQPPNVSQALVAAAKSVWNWKDLVSGGKPLQESPYISKTSGGTSSTEATLSGSPAGKSDNWCKGKSKRSVFFKEAPHRFFEGNQPEISISDCPSGGHHNSPSLKSNPKPNIPVSAHYGPQSYQTTYEEHVHRQPSNTRDSNLSKDELGGKPGCLSVPTEVQNILCALRILKADKMVPNETNIADCIRYGEMNIQNFNIDMALRYAVHHQLLVMHKLGGNLPFYVEKNDLLWKCINPIDINAKHPKATWDAVLRFLSSTAGRASMMTSQCRYQAAIIMRNSCLNHLVLGEILQILHVTVNDKRWIMPHPSGWLPLSFHLPDADKNTDVGASTTF
ncbi:hypothetical protein BHE74_00047357 [Ensete ventricosum]|nr:hypothetical protein BHE74_00047357 [Ensete ventricosum]